MTRQYQREYQLRRYHKRRKFALEFLGGKCVKCRTEIDLQIDHIDPSQKEFPISKLWGVSKKRFLDELAKCQLLCVEHHKEKTLLNGDGGRFYARCGTYTMYRKGCRCDACKNAERQQRKNWK